ncbi:site-specific integrase [uncultured Pseudoalteromonas sp.]|uniref:site-specific integrase n=1 Tax=uncultured Pseudoalteromonas sp. TaxID=114053 RepID=UPI0032B11C5F
MLSVENDPFREQRDARKLVLPVVTHATADITVLEQPDGSFPVKVEHEREGVSHSITYYIKPEDRVIVPDDSVYNFPFLFDKDGTPWNEANQYLFSLATNTSELGTGTVGLRRNASRLLDYKIFCESEGLDYLDFSGRRPANRPTYKYYHFLWKNGQIGAENINQRTGVVYSFYKWLSKQLGYDIDMERVDTVKSFKLLISTGTGSYMKELEKRSQTLSTSSDPKPVAMGYVRDEGEDLRPLTKAQSSLLIDTIRPTLSEDGVVTDSPFDVDEQLMCLFALTTGARKQSILTLRAKHLKQFTEKDLRNDGTYELRAGPGTGIDTKFNTRQRLYIPKNLLDELRIYFGSPLAAKRRKKFEMDYMNKYPDLLPISEDDMYVFLSEQGHCFYMAKDDPRYVRAKSPPIGQRTTSLKNKLLKFLPDSFPRDFTFHWLRATFALEYYNWLVPLVTKGKMTPSEQFDLVRRRLHHKNRETTENYLKLFADISDAKSAQELYESRLFDVFDISWKA